MGDNPLSEQEGIKLALLSAYCVGNSLCYEEQRADVCMSVSVSLCGLLLVEQVCCCGNPTRKETHQAHFVAQLDILQ